MYLNSLLQEKLTEFNHTKSKLTILTGAGLSADSGIPTFRDQDGYWTVGSVNYTPAEMGTLRMFSQKPLEVWKWCLYRQAVISNALPNIGHYAIKELEDIFEERFTLITQNVDGLHFKAQSSRDRTYLIHGTLERSRCGNECSEELYPFPNFSIHKNDKLTAAQIKKLKCIKCGHYLRPHVLWFDELYNEKQFKLESSLRTANETGLLLIIGSSGATTLPQRIVDCVIKNQGMIIDINPNENYFSTLVTKYNNGYSLKGKSSEVLPEIVQLFKSLKV